MLQKAATQRWAHYLFKLGTWLVTAFTLFQAVPDDAALAGSSELALVVATSGKDSKLAMPTSVASIVGFGDSIIVGRGATEEPKRWLNLVASSMGARTVRNFGRSGTVLQNSPDATGVPRKGNGRNRFEAALTPASAAKMVVIAYGYNDARYVANPDQFNVTSYIRDYRDLIIGLIAAGYARDRIVIVSPYYISDLGLQRGSKGFRGQSRAGFEAYVAASRHVAEEFNVYWADTYSALKVAHEAGQIIWTRDQIHPNDLGHDIIKTAVLAATKRP